MANHSRYIREVLKPVAYYSFDSDTIWDIDSKILVHGDAIPDDSGNGSPINGIMQADYTDNRPSYVMGQNSLVQLLQSDSYSLVLGAFGRDEKNNNFWVKSYIEVPYDGRMKMDQSFSIALLLNVQVNPLSNITYYAWSDKDKKYSYNGSSTYYYKSIYRTIFAKAGVCSIVMYRNWQSYYDSINFTFPNNTGSIYIRDIVGGFDGVTHYWVMTHEVTKLEDGRFYTTSTVYLNNRVVYSNVSSTTYGTYTAGSSAPFLIGGNNSSYGMDDLNDRTTSPTTFDEIQIYDYALQPFNVAGLYKKTFVFQDVILRGKPNLYYPFFQKDTTSMPDISGTSSSNITYNIGYRGELFNQIVKNVDGVHGIYGTSCLGVQNGGMLYCVPYTYSGSPYRASFFNTSGDYTIEFYFSFNSNTRGIVLSIQDDTTPFLGIALYANSRNGQLNSGSLQLSFSENTHIHTDEYTANGNKINYNDGLVRHYAIRRSGVYTELWIDGVIIGRTYTGANNITNGNNSMYMFGMMPGNLYVSGTIQHMCFYTRALTASELLIRSNYLMEYIIDGRVTVQGSGQRIMLRLYNFNSGQLVLSQYSDEDGYYRLRVPSDDYFTVMALNPTNNNIRPRTIGPTLADKYQDLPY